MGAGWQQLLLMGSSATVTMPNSMLFAGECCIAMRSMISSLAQQFETFLYHRGEETGSMRGWMKVRVPKDRRSTRERLYGNTTMLLNCFYSSCFRDMGLSSSLEDRMDLEELEVPVPFPVAPVRGLAWTDWELPAAFSLGPFLLSARAVGQSRRKTFFPCTSVSLHNLFFSAEWISFETDATESPEDTSPCTKPSQHSVR